MKKFVLHLAYLAVPVFCYSSNPGNIVFAVHVGYPFIVGDNFYHKHESFSDFQLSYDLKGSLFLNKNLSAALTYRAAYLHFPQETLIDPAGNTASLQYHSFFNQIDPCAEYRFAVTEKLAITPLLGFGFSYLHLVSATNSMDRSMENRSGYNILTAVSVAYKISSKFDVEAQGSYSFNKMSHNDAEDISYNKQAQIITASLGVAYRL